MHWDRFHPYCDQPDPKLRFYDWIDRDDDYRDYLVSLIDYHPDNWWIVMLYVETVDTDSPEGEKRLSTVPSVDPLDE